MKIGIKIKSQTSKENPHHNSDRLDFLLLQKENLLETTSKKEKEGKKPQRNEVEINPLHRPVV
jgi:hypothetical protein